MPMRSYTTAAFMQMNPPRKADSSQRAVLGSPVKEGGIISILAFCFFFFLLLSCLQNQIRRHELCGGRSFVSCVHAHTLLLLPLLLLRS